MQPERNFSGFKLPFRWSMLHEGAQMMCPVWQAGEGEAGVCCTPGYSPSNKTQLQVGGVSSLSSSHPRWPRKPDGWYDWVHLHLFHIQRAFSHPHVIAHIHTHHIIVTLNRDKIEQRENEFVFCISHGNNNFHSRRTFRVIVSNSVEWQKTTSPANMSNYSDTT